MQLGNKLWLLTSCALIVLFLDPAMILAKPYRLADSESAIMITPGNIDVAVAGSYETGLLPSQLFRLKARFGFAGWVELYSHIDAIYFPDQEILRESAVDGMAKVKLPFNLQRLELYYFIRYHHGLGEPVVVPVTLPGNQFRNVTGLVSRHADGGRDLFTGLLSRVGYDIFGSRQRFFANVAYSRAEGRNFGDFDGNKNRLHLMVAPYFHISRQFMVALENQVLVWVGRGTGYDLFPQIRWEFEPFTILEVGVGIPVIGIENYRFNAGIKYGIRP